MVDVRAKRQSIVIIALLIFAFGLIVPQFLPIQITGVECTYAHDDGSHYMEENAAHQWITRKAVEHVKQKDGGLARMFPLDNYLPWLYFGAWWADNTGLTCTWDADLDPFGVIDIYSKDDNCDSIHHYGWPSTIETEAGIDVAHPGDFAAPFYANQLYELAVKFWPGGTRPDLNGLPYKDAGSAVLLYTDSDLMNTYVGGLPFCERYLFEIYMKDCPPYDPINLLPYLECYENQLTRAVESCPVWPSWAAVDDEWKETEESIITAMIYLGWALHMIQDMTVPFHAFNAATLNHAQWEDWANDVMKEDWLDHLPVPPGSSYLDWGDGIDLGIPVFEDYYYTSWTAEGYALEGRTKALDIAGFFYFTTVYSKAYAEVLVDLAIKLCAGVLEKYFTEVSPPSTDQLEENDTFFEAQDVSPGLYRDLTVFPNDEDWYKIHVEENSSDLGIDIIYDKTAGDLSARVESNFNFWQGLPVETSYGKRIEMRGIQAGEYYLHISPYDRPVRYEMIVAITTGSLSLDGYEPNDTPETAAEFFEGCAGLTIHDNTDDDFYYLDIPRGYRFTAEIEFDPVQGELQIFFDGLHTTYNFFENDHSKRIRVSGCPFEERALVMITGSRNSYTLCMSSNPDTVCGYEEPPIEGTTGFCFESDVDLDNVRIVSFRRVAGAADVFLPPDLDGDVGGNVSSGQSCFSLTPLWQNPNQNHYVVIATTEDEKDLVVSASAIDLTATDFDTMFPEFGLYGGESNLIADLSDGRMIQDLEMLLDNAGEPDGLLLTPFGRSATLYRFSTGEPIGKVTANQFGNPEIPGDYAKKPQIFIVPKIQSFGERDIGNSSGPRRVLISNLGTADLSINTMTLSDASNFSLDVGGGSNPCGSTTPTVAAGNSCTIAVTFRPLLTGPFNASLTIDSNDPTYPSVNVILTGRGTSPPVAEAGGPYTGTIGSPVTFDATGSYDSDGWIVLYEWDFDGDGTYDWSSSNTGSTSHSYATSGVYTATLRVTDNDGLTGTDTASVEIVNQPPVALCQDVTIDADEDCQGSASIDHGSYDPDGDPITIVQTPPGPYGLGTTMVTLMVTDSAGGTDSCTGSVTVVDTISPSIHGLAATPNVLWPPNHKMKPVKITVSVVDNCQAKPSCCITSVNSNEPEEGLGNGDKAPDWEITGPLTVKLKAERSGKGRGRVYTVTTTCTDTSGNRASGTVNVSVPHDQGKK